MRIQLYLIPLLALGIAGGAHAQQQMQGTPTQANGECPAGMTEVRPGRCQAPELPAPSILDYRPRSTLVVPEHKVPKAKYPAIDYHGHITGLLNTPAGMDSVRRAMDALNLGVIIATDNVSGDRLKTMTAAVAANPALKNRIRFMTGINFTGAGTPEWVARTIAQLRADAAAGEVAIGEIGKNFGLTATKADGSRLRIDDPSLDPVWQEAARLNLPVFIHTADPQEFFRDTID